MIIRSIKFTLRLCLVPATDTLRISRMTSVLNLGGLNYQNGNPVRLGIEANRNDITELRKVIDALTADVTSLKTRLTTAEKDVATARSDAAEAKGTVVAAVTATAAATKSSHA